MVNRILKNVYTYNVLTEKLCTSFYSTASMTVCVQEVEVVERASDEVINCRGRQGMLITDCACHCTRYVRLQGQHWPTDTRQHQFHYYGKASNLEAFFESYLHSEGCSNTFLKISCLFGIALPA